MAFLSKERVKEIIQNKPENLSATGVIATLRAKGHTLEGFPEKERRPLTRAERGERLAGLREGGRRAREIMEEETAGIGEGRGSDLLSVNTYLEGIGAMIHGPAQVPQSLYVVGGRETGRLLGGVPPGEVARETGEAVKGVFRGAGRPFMGEAVREEELPTPSGELGVGGVPGFVIDVIGDPANLLGLAAKGADKADDVIRASRKTKPLLVRWGEKLYQATLKPSSTDETKAFAQMGKKLTRGRLGKRLSQYGVRGGLDDMIEEINRRIPKLGKQLDEAIEQRARQARLKDGKWEIDTVDLGPITKRLRKMAKNARRIKDENLAGYFDEAADEIAETGEELALDRAVELRRLYDEARETATGRLSEAQAAKNQIYKVIGDELRDGINKAGGEIGEINKELTTHYDALRALARESKKWSERLPGFRFGPPFVSTGLPKAKAKTAMGQAAIRLGKLLDVPTRRTKEAINLVMPGLIQEIFGGE